MESTSSPVPSPTPSTGYIVRFATVRNAKDKIPKPAEADEPAFIALFKHEIGAKDGTGFLPCTFSGTGRKDSDVETITLLVYDVDHDVKDVDEHLTLWPWRGFSYTTARHTAKKPRFRVVLFLSRSVTPGEHAELWDWGLRRSEGRIDRQCKNPARLYYFPRVPDELALQSAWIRTLDGPILNPEECVLLPEGTAVEAAMNAALQQADRDGSRNRAGYDLARKLWRMGQTVEQITTAGNDFIRLSPVRDHPYTIDEFLTSIAQVEKHPPTVTAGTSTEFPFREVGAEILSKHPILLTAKDNPWEYVGTHWVPITHGRLAALVQAHAPQAKAKDAAETIAFISRVQHVGHTTPDFNQIAIDEIPFKNGVLSLSSGSLRPHRKEDYLDRTIPYDWTRDAECPTWERCLQDWIDHEKQRALQEYFGYVLLPHTRWKKALILYGESDTGKSRVTDVMVSMVGQRYVSCIALDQMDDSRKLAPLRGAAINLISDLKESTILADGGFKGLVSGDPVEIDPKYEAQELYRPTAKLVVATNNLPKVNDRTLAVYNRLLIVHFDRVIPAARQDRALAARLAAETPGVLVWAVEGAHRLAAAGGTFSPVSTSVAIVADYRDEQNPVIGFLAERTVSDETARIRVSELHKAYQEWSGERVPVAVFGRMLRAAGAEAKLLKFGSTAARGVVGRRLG